MKYVIVALALALVVGYTAVYTPPPPQTPIDVTNLLMMNGQDEHSGADTD